MSLVARMFVLLILSCASILAHAQNGVESLFYYVNDESSFESLAANIDRISILAPVAYNVDQDGVVWGSVDPRVLKLCKERGVKVMPLIDNPGFEQAMLSTLLASATARSRAIESMLDECKRYSYYGIQFDFENLGINDKDNFSQFVRETADVLHKNGFKISAAVVHRPDKFPGPTKYFKWLYKNWRAGYDLTALGKTLDFISIMTYSQHTRRTPPGPNAGIPWMIKNIKFFLEEVPAEKLSLGIPTTSQHWNTEQDDEKYVANARSWSRSLKYSEATALAEQFDAKINWLDDQKVAYTFFENGGLFEYIFFEDARSFQHKLDLVKEYKLRGFSVWVIGQEDPNIWKSLESTPIRKK